MGSMVWVNIGSGLFFVVFSLLIVVPQGRAVFNGFPSKLLFILSVVAVGLWLMSFRAYMAFAVKGSLILVVPLQIAYAFASAVVIWELILAVIRSVRLWPRPKRVYFVLCLWVFLSVTSVSGLYLFRTSFIGSE